MRIVVGGGRRDNSARMIRSSSNASIETSGADESSQPTQRSRSLIQAGIAPSVPLGSGQK
jgi:hypothetical protein